MQEDLLNRITMNPDICFGKPCIRGHRIWVTLILDLLADGRSFDQIKGDYPGITDLDIRACIAYGSKMARDPFVELSVGSSR